jgi:hypothetical protein
MRFIRSWLAKKRGPKAPKNLALRLFTVAAVAIVRIGWQCDEPGIKGEGLEFDGEPESVLMRERCANFCPAFLCFAVPFVLFDGEDVKCVERICFPDRREANPWRLRTKLPVLYAPENKHRST